jgi:hypothetical protein
MNTIRHLPAQANTLGQDFERPTIFRHRLAGMASVIALALNTACASSPDSIQARYVSPNMYQTWNCEQLRDERARLTSEVQRVSGLQRENANADVAMMTVGIIILWPVLLGLAATKDRKDELGRLKGEYDAVDLSVRTRSCTLPPPLLGALTAPAAPAREPLAASTNLNGSYKGKATTESWCQPASLSLNIKGDTVDGQLSENITGSTTSAVSGTVDTSGVVGLQFKANNTDYFTGRVDGAFNGTTMVLDIRTTTAKACTYHFELVRAALVAVASPD